MATIARHCPLCKKYAQTKLLDHQEVLCPLCKSMWGKTGELNKIFENCPICQCRQFYVHKDFNQAVGCLIMGVGIVLVPWTYGLSLPFFAFIDWLLHKRVSSLVACYKCGSEFRGFPIPKNFKSFMHHIGLKYDKFR